MGKFLVGTGLVMMLSAVAFFTTVADDPAVPVSVVNAATTTAVWGFLAGAGVAVIGSWLAGRLPGAR